MSEWETHFKYKDRLIVKGWRKIYHVIINQKKGEVPTLISDNTDFRTTTNKHYPEKAMATHSSTLAWKMPWTQEPGRLQSMRSRKVRHDWVTTFTFHTLYLSIQPKELFYLLVYFTTKALKYFVHYKIFNGKLVHF